MRAFFIIFLLSIQIFGAETFKLDAGIYALFQPQKFYKSSTQWFAIPYADMSYKRLHLFPRYNFDLLNTGSINFCYDALQSKDKNSFFTPSLGYAWGQATGPIAGFQASFVRENFQFYGINQYLFCTDQKNLQNWYTWSEVNYKIFKYLRPGFSIFLRHFTQTHAVFFDFGPVFIGEYKKARISAYLMNIWNEKRYVFIGISYSFS